MGTDETQIKMRIEDGEWRMAKTLIYGFPLSALTVRYTERKPLVLDVE
jgi:hypothetical protein